MATVDGITVAKAQEIEDASVVSGEINPTNGHLILTTGDGTDIDAGAVIPTNLLNHADDNTGVHGVATVAGLTEAQIMTNKTLVTPTVASLINMQHDHDSTAKGGSVKVDAVRESIDTSLTVRTMASGEVDTPRSLATTDTLPPGKHLIIGSIRGFTLDAGTPTRLSYYMTTSAGTLYGNRVDVQSEQITIQGGMSVIYWLENSADAIVTFNVEKTNTGAVATTLAQGTLLAIRLSDMT